MFVVFAQNLLRKTGLNKTIYGFGLPKMHQDTKFFCLKAKMSVPLQFAFGHSWLSEPVPGHTSPPFCGAGLLHWRVRNCTPLLQTSFSEHSPQGPQGPHAPFTTSVEGKSSTQIYLEGRILFPKATHRH